MRNVSLPRFLVCLYVTLSVFSCLETIAGYSINEHNVTLSRFRRQATKCNGFKCGTGECLEVDKRCDGKVDCSDGSDEFNDCKDIKCPGFLFTCDYGACIEMENKCDGKKDCRDNSDEANCVLSNNVEKVSSNCKSDQFECESGQCIPQDAKCNGKADCEDKSDETKETCLNIQCPGWTFKCDYGACIDGFAKCDQVKDCIDNSDEEDCGEAPIVTPKPVVQPPVVQPGAGCVLPDHPAFGQWSIVGAKEDKSPAQKVGISTSLEFSCNDGYKLSSENKYVLCLGTEWSVAQMPTCLKKCRAFYSNKFVTITCHDSRKIPIKCEDATDGTSATFKCAQYYEPPDRTPETRFCYGGTWNYPEPVCQPVCGEKRVSAEPLIVNGQTVEKGDYPWVAALYHIHADGSHENVCGGSMLTQRIILTAAHCVTDNRGTALPKESIEIAIGKYYNKYRDPRDTQAQYSKISKIEVPEHYKADNQRFAFDIAVLVTQDDLLLSKVVQPVCYQNIGNRYLDSHVIGVVAGWGFTVSSGEPSDELREVDVPYKDDSECKKELPPDWADKYYTYDKMCAGHYNKSIAVCKGDSGSGLVFRHEKRFYIHGVVSLGHGLQNGCNIQVSSLYTKISSHYEWLEQKIAQYGSY